MEGEDVFNVEHDPSLDEVEVFFAWEEAGVAQQLTDLAGVHLVPVGGILLSSD